MKRLSLSILMAGMLLALNGCIPVGPPLIHPVAPYGAMPYGGVPYGGVPYGGGYGVGGIVTPGYIGVAPRIFGGYRGGWGGGGFRGGWGGAWQALKFLSLSCNHFFCFRFCRF